MKKMTDEQREDLEQSRHVTKRLFEVIDEEVKMGTTPFQMSIAFSMSILAFSALCQDPEQFLTNLISDLKKLKKMRINKRIDEELRGEDNG